MERLVQLLRVAEEDEAASAEGRCEGVPRVGIAHGDGVGEGGLVVALADAHGDAALLRHPGDLL